MHMCATHAQACISSHSHICYTCVHTCVCANMYVHIHHMYAHTHTCNTHVYTHTQQLPAAASSSGRCTEQAWPGWGCGWSACAGPTHLVVLVRVHGGVAPAEGGLGLPEQGAPVLGVVGWRGAGAQWAWPAAGPLSPADPSPKLGWTPCLVGQALFPPSRSGQPRTRQGAHRPLSTSPAWCVTGRGGLLSRHQASPGRRPRPSPSALSLGGLPPWAP